MAETTFPSEIKLPGLMKYTGAYGTLDDLASSVHRCLLVANIPAEYAGTLSGSPDDEYTYVSYGEDPFSKDNLFLGKRVCAYIADNFKGAAMEWYNYQSQMPQFVEPNCWRKHGDLTPSLRKGNPLPLNTVETSLYDLLKLYAEPECYNSLEALKKLESLHWDPLTKKAPSLSGHRARVEKLLNILGYYDTFSRIALTYKTLPNWLLHAIDHLILSSEVSVWEQVRTAITAKKRAVSGA
ncbi:hypothetical protein H072_190 [Dactylellina haptotyla CBS 200.50]|uniref:Uncharacterized protein n=1 Tax=Dactylellina haptotyla (strain CBS 200.50) TaxID=1284197 RepID=S8ASR1_DACHA|nr:hypothetical protein H072_190 [Dactylellina haptotyla CBS 200.50]